MNSSDIVARLLATETRGDLLALFHLNPGLIDSVEGVALRIGRRAESIEADVNDFVELGLLKTRNIGNHRVFWLDRERDAETQRIVADHVQSSSVQRSS